MTMKAIPDQSPQEAGAIACGRCGTILQPTAVMAFGRLDHILYECKNETTGCNWLMEKRVFVQGGQMQGIRADGTKVVV